MRDPDTLASDDAQQLAGILACCPELEATCRHVGAFAVMKRDLRGDRLPEWMSQVRADNLPALHSFVTGLEHDFAAVTAGLTLPWRNGPVEGTVNKLKHHKPSASAGPNWICCASAYFSTTQPSTSTSR